MEKKGRGTCLGERKWFGWGTGVSEKPDCLEHYEKNTTPSRENTTRKDRNKMQKLLLKKGGAKSYSTSISKRRRK